MDNKIILDVMARELSLAMTIQTLEIWTAVITPERDPRIQSKTACLWLSEDWRTHRLNIHAAAHATLRERTTGEKITCNPTRSYESIARDIVNKLLPHARDHQTESRLYTADTIRKDNAKNTRLRMIKKYLPREYQSEKLCNGRDKRGAANIFAHITYDNLINVEMTLTLSETLQVLEYLKSKGLTTQ